MNQFKAITTVYSYYLPEIREIITGLTREYPHEVFLKSIVPGLDDFHQPIIDKLVNVHRHDVPHLNRFDCRYSTAGSEEGIREYLTFLQTTGVKEIYVWNGDYEGYREVAKTRDVKALEVEYDADPAQMKPGYWFLSNPSARDGMVVPHEKIDAIAEAGHKVFYDLSYLGATEPTVFDLSHSNVVAATISFSKPFGLFYYRVGFTFAREPIPALYANKWFKNVYGLLIADKILDEIDQAELTQKYKGIQREIVDGINGEFGLGLSASDAFLLARLPAIEGVKLSKDRQNMIEKFKRHDWHRFCLTPYFEGFERDL